MNHPPFKNVATALLFSVLLGPVGLLYASFWGGFSMIFIALLTVINRAIFPSVIVWLISCIWSVAAVENYNKKLAQGKLA